MASSTAGLRSTAGQAAPAPRRQSTRNARVRNVCVAASGWREVDNSAKAISDRFFVEANTSVLAPRGAQAEMQGDPFGTLLKKRVVFFSGEVEDFGADALVSQLLLLDSQAAAGGEDIKMYINSPGGSVTAGLGIYDAMHLCRSDISTVCFGLAASMGAFLLGAGKKGKRYSLPNSRIMIHQPLGGAGGAAVDMEISAKEIMFHKGNLNRIIAGYTGQDLSTVERDTDRDNYMNPIQAREYGIIDHVVGPDELVHQVQGSIRRFPKIKEQFIHDLDDLARRNIMDGDPFSGATPSWRFKSRDVEPYMPSQAAGSPWFRTKRISRDEYKQMLQRNKEAAKEAAGTAGNSLTAKEKIDTFLEDDW